MSSPDSYVGLDVLKTHSQPCAHILKDNKDISLRGCMVCLGEYSNEFSTWEKDAGSKESRSRETNVN